MHLPYALSFQNKPRGKSGHHFFLSSYPCIQNIGNSRDSPFFFSPALFSWSTQNVSQHMYRHFAFRHSNALIFSVCSSSSTYPSHPPAPPSFWTSQTHYISPPFIFTWDFTVNKCTHGMSLYWWSTHSWCTGGQSQPELLWTSSALLHLFPYRNDNICILCHPRWNTATGT